ncbi:MAG: hypothetical protein IJV83_05325 [Clostridia bacterium]|nr:hypothetical protein [Schwartzia sp. (in: firmicutes)]MBQ9714723.1 hypothetical protein [Clostridia bacterium]
MPANQNQLEYIREYNKAHYDKVTFLLPSGTKTEWKEIADRVGLSITKMVISAVEKFSKKN